MKKRDEWSKAKPVIDAALQQQFWTKVDASGGAESCWPWQAAFFTDDRAGNNNGRGNYGCFSLRFDDGKRRVRKASRVAWALANGRWPELNELVEHVCDNPPCCNPRHLRLGVNATNSADMALKGRASQGDEHWTRQRPEDTVRGSAIGNSKLSEEQVLIIRVAWKSVEWFAPRGFKTYLGKMFDVTKTMIGYILNGSWWSHIQVPADIAAIAPVANTTPFSAVVKHATDLVKTPGYKEFVTNMWMETQKRGPMN